MGPSEGSEEQGIAHEKYGKEDDERCKARQKKRRTRESCDREDERRKCEERLREERESEKKSAGGPRKTGEEKGFGGIRW